jgi:hypothetical protein
MTDWVTAPFECTAIVSGPELVADAGVRGIPAGVVCTVVTVARVWAVTGATFWIAWPLVD